MKVLCIFVFSKFIKWPGLSPWSKSMNGVLCEPLNSHALVRDMK